jgi:VanZ family protein
MKDFARYQLPLLIWAAIIFLLSSLSRLPHVNTPFISADKLAHLFVYFVFCLFSRRALYFQAAFSSIKKFSLIWAFIVTVVYGYLDEVHQLFVPGRTYDYFDLLADAIGALMFIALFIFLHRWKRPATS